MSEADANFEQIVAYARETNPFYAEWLKDSVPILPRRVLLENNDRILNGHPVRGVTSGSTGVPVRISMSPRRLALLRQLSARYDDWLGGQLITSQILFRRGFRGSLLSVNAPMEAQIDWLKKRFEIAGAVALLTHPTNAFMLAQAILAGEHDMGFLRRVGLVGETFDPGDRPYLQGAFPNALISSTYSSVEFGLIAGQCPHEPDFHHIMSDCFRVEVVDHDNDRPCGEGEIGRVIITDYFNDWSPLIRYEIGDLAAFGSCPCNRIPFPAFSAVLGKVRGALKHRSGRRIMFFQLSVALRDLPGMKQYQVVQESLDHFIVRLVIDQPHEQEIAAAFETHFGYRPQLTFEYLEAIPREASGKFHSSICRV